MIFSKNKQGGFTLIELLVVIAIIGVLMSVVLASLSSARARARDSFRKQSLKNIQTALESYYIGSNGYPSTSSGWHGVNHPFVAYTTSGPSGYIPGLAPTYIPVLPIDPSGNTDDWHGFFYKSNGKGYKLVSLLDPESFPSLGQPFYDSARVGTAWMVCGGDTRDPVNPSLSICNTW